jgi:hypothetical protein
MLNKLLYSLIGLALAPFCWVFGCVVWALLSGLKGDHSAWMTPGGWAFVAGFVLEVVLYLTLPRPMRTYVLAHEMSHALWGVVLGARVHGMQIGRDSGRVSLSHTNFLITLAPYFFPFYTVLIIAVYQVAGLFIDLRPYEIFWMGAVGFSWAFHVTFTISTLMTHQSDIEAYGGLFSYVLIVMLNLAGVALWIVGVSSPTMMDCGALTAQYSRETWVWISENMVSAAKIIYSAIKGQDGSFN